MKWIEENLSSFTKINVDSWDTIKDNVFARIINAKFLSKFQDVCYKKYLDLSIIFYVREIVKGKMRVYYFKKTDLETYGIDDKKLYQTAKENTLNDRKKRIVNFEENILMDNPMYPLCKMPSGHSMGVSGPQGEGIGGIINAFDKEGTENILVLKNKQSCFGSIYFCFSEVLDEVYSRFNDNNFYILPISTHEVWCIKRSYLLKQNTVITQKEVEDDLLDLVEEVNDNRNESWQDVLSYNLYYFIGDDGKMVFPIYKNK